MGDAAAVLAGLLGAFPHLLPLWLCHADPDAREAADAIAKLRPASARAAFVDVPRSRPGNDPRDTGVISPFIAAAERGRYDLLRLYIEAFAADDGWRPPAMIDAERRLSIMWVFEGEICRQVCCAVEAVLAHGDAAIARELCDFYVLLRGRPSPLFLNKVDSPRDPACLEFLTDLVARGAAVIPRIRLCRLVCGGDAATPLVAASLGRAGADDDFGFMEIAGACPLAAAACGACTLRGLDQFLEFWPEDCEAAAVAGLRGGDGDGDEDEDEVLFPAIRATVAGLREILRARAAPGCPRPALSERSAARLARIVDAVDAVLPAAPPPARAAAIALND